MSQQQNQAEDIFGPLLVGGFLIIGAIIGGVVAQHLVPDSALATLAGLLLLPAGFIAGLSIAEGASPALAVVNLFSLLDGRHQLNEVVPSGGLVRLGTWAVAGPLLSAALVALVLSGAGAPLSFGALALRFGAEALVFGALMAGMIVFLMPEQRTI